MMEGHDESLMPSAQSSSELIARVESLEAEVRQRDEDHMIHVMELSGRLKEYVQKMDASEADASRLRTRLAERERQLEQRSSFEVESLQCSSGGSCARCMEKDLELRTCE